MFAPSGGAYTRWERQPAEIQALRPRLEAILGCPVTDMADASIRYLYADPRVHHISVGSSRIDSLKSSIAAVMAGPLEADVTGLVRELTGWRG
jgi:hypothetical protein